MCIKFYIHTNSSRLYILMEDQKGDQDTKENMNTFKREEPSKTRKQYENISLARNPAKFYANKIWCYSINLFKSFGADETGKKS